MPPPPSQPCPILAAGRFTTYKLEGSSQLGRLRTGQQVTVRAQRLGALVSPDGTAQVEQLRMLAFSVEQEPQYPDRQVIISPPAARAGPGGGGDGRPGRGGGALGGRGLLQAAAAGTQARAEALAGLPTIQISLEAASVSVLVVPVAMDGCGGRDGGVYPQPWYTKAVRRARSWGQGRAGCAASGSSGAAGGEQEANCIPHTPPPPAQDIEKAVFEADNPGRPFGTLGGTFRTCSYGASVLTRANRCAGRASGGGGCAGLASSCRKRHAACVSAHASSRQHFKTKSACPGPRPAAWWRSRCGWRATAPAAAARPTPPSPASTTTLWAGRRPPWTSWRRRG